VYIFEIVVPGESLELPGLTPRAKWDMEDMLRALNAQFFEANFALNLFEQARPKEYQTPSMEAWQRRVNRSQEIEEIVEQELGPPTDFFKTDIRFETDIRLKREEWAAGKLPSEFEHQLSFLYAKAFLSALDSFEKHLGKIPKAEGAPPVIADLHKKMVAAFPDLRAVRNSVQHNEERIRSKGFKEKDLDLQPLPNGMAPPELKVLALNNLHGSKFCTTMDNGSYGEVDISPESMEILQGILQETLNAFTWTGPKRHLPSAPNPD
jgi:hypothetical protein